MSYPQQKSLQGVDRGWKKQNEYNNEAVNNSRVFILQTFKKNKKIQRYCCYSKTYLSSSFGARIYINNKNNLFYLDIKTYSKYEVIGPEDKIYNTYIYI